MILYIWWLWSDQFVQELCYFVFMSIMILSLRALVVICAGNVFGMGVSTIISFCVIWYWSVYVESSIYVWKLCFNYLKGTIKVFVSSD